MYFFKENGKQVIDLTGNLILSFNDALIKARAPSAAPDAVKNKKFIMINELGFYRKIKATFIVIGFIWGKDQQLLEVDTVLNKPYVKPPIDAPTPCVHLHENKECCTHINNLDNSCTGCDECKDYADNDIKCPVIDMKCEHYIYQLDGRDEVAIEHCNHPENKSDYEGNCNNELCPLLVRNNGRPDVPSTPPIKPVE